jgi:hypothetical protein
MPALLYGPPGELALEEISEKTGIPIEDEEEKARFSKFFWNSLWRIRMVAWRDGYEEVAITLRSPAEFIPLEPFMRRALKSL